MSRILLALVLAAASTASGSEEDAPWRPFETPVKHDPPSVGNASWRRNAIDQFILKRLEAEGMSPAPAASRRTLARRAYLDLIGLPPTPAELSEFLSDDSPTAFAELVDRLLDDPRYGERWGRHWLDLARYGETNGLEGDGAIGNAWRYRDWVIEAFNDDMPYDRFVILQLAGGDEHSQTRNNYVPDPQGYIPTGFLRVAPWDRSNLVAAEVRQNLLNEMTTATGSILLGLSIGCARCHDHKYDPIPQQDFYRLQAFFNAIQVEDRQGAIQPLRVPYKDKAFAAKARRNIEECEKRLEDGPEKKQLDALERTLLDKLIAAKKEKAKGAPLTASDLRLELRRNDREIFTREELRRHADVLSGAMRTRDPEEDRLLKAHEAPLLGKLARAYAREDVDPLARFDSLTVADVQNELQAQYSVNSVFTADEQEQQKALSDALEVLRRRAARWQRDVLGVRNVPGPPSGPPLSKTRVLRSGDYRQPAEAVEPGFPSALSGSSEPARLETDRYRQFPTRGLRWTLAKWIASPDNPLTARVMVNRIWQHHFGEGIVRTPSDFGNNGDPPSHPELLDWLAVTFVEQGWSIKAMHRLMLSSNTYQQSAENPSFESHTLKDSENRLLWRFNRRRLEAEAIRDCVLFVSGRLNPERGGPSVFPPLPDDLADFARYGRTGRLMWEPNAIEDDALRRSVYIFQRRSLPLPMMAAFDATVFSESCPRRSVTTERV